MPAFFYLLTGAFAWCFALGLANVLVPLYAYDLGYSPAAIGLLVSLPVIVQVCFRWFGGAAGDRWGARVLLFWTFGTTVVAAPIFYVARSYGILLLAQGVINLSRSTYWVGAQSMTSQLPGQSNVQLGRLNAVNNLGQIMGLATAGLLITGLGYSRSFLVMAGLAGVAILAATQLPPGERREGSGYLQVFRDYGVLLRSRPLYFAIFCSYVGGMPYTLANSFYPVLMAEWGYPKEVNTLLVAIRSIGAVAFGFLLARYITQRWRIPSILLTVVGSAVAFGLTPLSNHFLLVGLILAMHGLTHGNMELNYQLVSAEAGGGGAVSSALAVGGMGWSLAHVTVPLLFGLLASLFGLTNAFYIWSGVMLAVALATPLLYRWAFAPGAGTGGMSRMAAGP